MVNLTLNFSPFATHQKSQKSKKKQLDLIKTLFNSKTSNIKPMLDSTTCGS